MVALEPDELLGTYLSIQVALKQPLWRSQIVMDRLMVEQRILVVEFGLCARSIYHALTK